MTDEELKLQEEREQRELESLREQRHALRNLLESPEWKVLQNIGNEQIQMRINKIILTPLETRDATLKQEYEKGEIQGIKLFFALPETLIDQCSETIRAITKGADEDE